MAGADGDRRDRRRGHAAVRAPAGPNNVLAHFRPDVRADAILWGCLIALVPLSVPRWAALASGIALVLVAFSILWPSAIALSSVLSAVFIAGAAGLAPVLSARPLVRIGQISYGMYLWHAIPVGLLDPQTLAGNVFAMAAVVVITIALALASERWVEKPFRRPRQAPVSGFASEPTPTPTPTAV